MFDYVILTHFFVAVDGCRQQMTVLSEVELSTEFISLALAVFVFLAFITLVVLCTCHKAPGSKVSDVKFIAGTPEKAHTENTVLYKDESEERQKSIAMSHVK